MARPLAESSWGAEKDLRTWDSPRVAEFAWAARQAELDLVAAVGSAERPLAGDLAAAARRAARELLALQSSDWSFMVTRGLAGDYPATRVRNHAACFREALSALRGGMADFRAMREAIDERAARDWRPASTSRRCSSPSSGLGPRRWRLR